MVAFLGVNKSEDLVMDIILPGCGLYKLKHFTELNRVFLTFQLRKKKDKGWTSNLGMYMLICISFNIQLDTLYYQARYIHFV